YLIEVLKANPERVSKQPYEVPDARSLDDINPQLTVVSPQSPRTFESLDRPVFIFVGSIVARKGVRCLIDACKRLNDEGISNFTVLIVGDGEQRGELEALSQTYQLGNCVEWVGRVDYSDIGTYFNQSDVFVLPTLEDTWGMVVLEAMLLGKAILCSTGAGASELVTDASNGYRFPPENPDKLAEVMKQLIENPDKIPAMSTASKQVMAQNSPKIAADFMADIVTTLKPMPPQQRSSQT
ncbi:MAG: glycosyltransferase family 4 protein, partial [Cyanobacteria bacterium J06555_13]